MHMTKSPRPHRYGSGRPTPATPMYWGWSPRSGRMEMMDLRDYVDSMREGYDQAMEDLYGRMTAMSELMGSGLPAMSRWADDRPHGRHHDRHRDDCNDCGPGGHHRGQHRDSGEHGHSGRPHHGHGCGERDDCRCECCIVDADIVVYARCGEIRVVPIEIDNDTRKDREDVELEVSKFRSGSGRELPWQALLRPGGLLTIKGCSTVRLELLVAVVCGDGGKEDQRGAPGKRAAAGAAPEPPEALRQAARQRDTGDVDRCEVGYVTVRVAGCLVRPIVVAVAALPDDCDAYSATCSCGSCH